MRVSARTVVFVVLMLTLTALLAGLGTWQLDRLAWKRQLIAAAESRSTAEPAPLPAAGLWAGLRAEDYDFTAVTLTGDYADLPPVMVFTSLSDAKGQYDGPGHWVLHLFELAGGGRVWVNRGFVPQDLTDSFDPPPTGELTISGLMRRPEVASVFTPRDDIGARHFYVRDPKRFPAPEIGSGAAIAPFTVDLFADGSSLPQAGETVLDFPNRHFEYALTWYTLAAVTLIWLAFWLWRGRGDPPSLARPNPED